SRTSSQTFDAQQHAWLSHDPFWQSLVSERLQKRIASIKFRFDMDVSGLLKSQIQMFSQLMLELSSMALPSNYEELFAAELLHAQSVEVEFNKL
ncbi:MAG: hypothetical protein AAGF98_07595, partial [Cyanobacteria bacterium P01_H01_bin.153]